MSRELQHAIERDGFAVLRGAVSAAEVRAILAELEPALDHAAESAGPLRRERGAVAASRNLLRLWPSVLDLAHAPALRQAVNEVLGPGCGLVRALYFDKPPGRNWSLPWHKDMTIAVREHRDGGAQFGKPTHKGGVPHVEAPASVLRRMLTARVHLDDVTEDNGPLLVLPGSHREGKTAAPIASDAPVHAVLVAAGDVLLMRPLLTHCSRKSNAAARHRRIVHLEYAAADPLPEGYGWHTFSTRPENVAAPRTPPEHAR